MPEEKTQRPVKMDIPADIAGGLYGSDASADDVSNNSTPFKADGIENPLKADILFNPKKVT